MGLQGCALPACPMLVHLRLPLGSGPGGLGLVGSHPQLCTSRRTKRVSKAGPGTCLEEIKGTDSGGTELTQNLLQRPPCHPPLEGSE